MDPTDVEVREKFLFTLDWLLAVTKRNSASFRFGLAHIGYDPKILGETYGAKMASQQLDKVLHSLRKAFRKTDLIARKGSDFWVIVPFTPDVDTINGKIKHIIETATLAELHISEREISFFLLPFNDPTLVEDHSASELLDHLKNNHSSLASREVIIPANIYDAT